MIDKTSGIPVYKQVESALLADIERGLYPAGSKLPSEEMLAARFGVARGTIRQALSELANHGIIKRIHGSGTFVCEPGSEFKIDTEHFISFLEALEWEDKANTIVLEKQMQRLVGGPPQDLFPANSTFFSVKRLRKRGNKPVMFSVDHIPLALFPDIDQKYADQALIYEFLENVYSIRIKKVKRIFHAISATGEVAKMLALRTGEPVFYIVQQAFDEFDRCVDCADLYILSEEMHFSVTTYR
ncbi:MAG TPA: GntR family transcriptional regulator [Firmicutes bacterium]|nr:GntR family transcriptional regulator [Bacillota bacterium]